MNRTKQIKKTDEKPGLTDEKPGLRMSVLVQATNVPKSTILHYVKEGLLPAPVKTSPNMAYYDPECISRIKYIKMVQARYHLPLPRIKELIDSCGVDEGTPLDPILELNELIFGTPEKDTINLELFCKETGLTPESVNQLIRARVLIPLENGRFDPEDVRMGAILYRAQQLGMTADDGSYYATMADKIVDHEMNIRERLTATLPADEDATLTAALTRSARIMRHYIIDRVFQKRILEMASLKQQPLKGKKIKQ